MGDGWTVHSGDGVYTTCGTDTGWMTVYVGVVGIGVVSHTTGCMYVAGWTAKIGG